MANKPLQSIKFPGLSDTYTTPQVDATLTTTGAAADAKKTGDEITSIKEDLSLFDLEYDSDSKRIYLTLDGVRKGGGVDISNLIVDDKVDVSNLLIYFRSNVLDAINYVRTMPKTSVSHVCATDIHYNSNKKHSAAVCNLLMDTGLFDKLFILGDLTDDNTQAQYDNLISDGWGDHNGEIVFALGNHDVRTPTGGYPSYQDFYDDFLSKAQYGDATTLYYVYTDYLHMIKYVVINTETLTASSDDPQIQMISQAVSEQGWTVFVLGHRNMAVLPDGFTWAQSLPNNTTETLKTAIEGGSATIGGYICGHQHVDIFTPVDSKFYHVTLLNDRNEVQNYYDGYSVTNRPVGTVCEQAISIITIDPLNLFVDVYRIGAAYSTRNWRYLFATKSQNLPTQPNTHAVSNAIIVSTGNQNNEHFIADEEEYSTVLVPEKGFYFSNAQIVMGNSDITDNVLDDTEIVIPSVTDDVQINAYSYANEGNIINWERLSVASGNGAVTINKETAHITWETPGSTRAVAFAMNGVAPGQYYDVAFTPDEGYESDYGVKVNVHASITSSPSVSNDKELTKVSTGWTRRGIRIPDGYKTLKLSLYRPGTFTVKKRNVNYNEELFQEEKLDIQKKGDANYTFNSDGTITVTGTAPSSYSDSANVVFLVLRNVIVDGSYHIKVKSNTTARGWIGILAKDSDVFDGETAPTTHGVKQFNNSLTTINYDAHFVNNPGTSVLGRGSMFIALMPGATYEVSMKLDNPAELT